MMLAQLRSNVLRCAALTLLLAEPALADTKFTYDAAGNLTGVYNVSSDSKHCGAIGNQCTGPNACCSGGVCGYVSAGQCRQGEPFSIQVAPTSAAVEVGSQLRFTATGNGVDVLGVAWFVNEYLGGNATVGLIDETGLYTAPAALPSPSSVTIAAVPFAAPSIEATATVTVLAPQTFAISPSTATAVTGTSVQFQAVLGGVSGARAIWTVNGVAGGNSVVGTVSATGLYAAPLAVPNPTTVSVAAASTDSPGKVAQAVVTVAALTVTVAVSPSTSSLLVGQTRQFVATVGNSFNKAVTWMVNGVTSGNSTVGTITTAGLYTAPTSVTGPTPMTIAAVSSADTRVSAAATVQVSPKPVAVTISPGSVALTVKKTQQFSATVQNSTNTAVTWKVNGVQGGNATVGTITTGGRYTAPTAVPNPVTVTVSAASVADSTKSASASASVTTSTAVLVSVNPTSASVAVAQTQQYKATVQNTTTTTVTWKVNGVSGGNSTVGTISTAGLYKAPATVPSPASVTVTATSTVSTSSTGTAAATVYAPVTVAISPSTASVALAQTKQFVATVTNAANSSVTWSVNGTPGGDEVVGTISAGGLYLAPATLPTPAAIAVSATSVADSTRSASSTVTITPPAVSVAVSPTSASVTAKKTLQYSVSVKNTSNQAVTWKVNGVTGGSSAVGTISTAGLYTAPSVANQLSAVVSAVSAADTSKSATSSVTVIPAPTEMVTVSPPYVRLQVGAVQRFTAVVGNSGNQSVTWAVNGTTGGDSTFGIIGADGTYTAPPNVPTSPVVVSATSQANGSASDTATAVVLGIDPVTIALTPSRWYTLTSGFRQFQAKIANTSDATATWYVDGILGGDSTHGTVSDGLYRAPPRVDRSLTVTLTAVSNADPSKYALASISITNPAPITISVGPMSPVVQRGHSQQFSAQVYAPMNVSTNVLWTVNDVLNGDGTHGTITSYGYYTAPQAIPVDQVVVGARMVSSGYSATTYVTVVDSPPFSVVPAQAVVGINEMYQFMAYELVYTGLGASWSVNGVAGGNASVGIIGSDGLYTAPAQVPSPAQVTIAAVSNANGSMTGSAVITIRSIPTPTVRIVNPPAFVEVGKVVKYTTETTNLNDPTLTWKVNGVPGGNATNGTILADGSYHAPASVPTPPTVTVTATSSVDPVASVDVAITIIPANPPSLAVNQVCEILIPAGATYHWSALVRNLSNSLVVWEVRGAAPGDPLKDGTINSATGDYRAPPSVPEDPSIPIVVISKDDPTLWHPGYARIIP